MRVKIYKMVGGGYDEHHSISATIVAETEGWAEVTEEELTALKNYIDECSYQYDNYFEYVLVIDEDHLKKPEEFTIQNILKPAMEAYNVQKERERKRKAADKKREETKKKKKEERERRQLEKLKEKYGEQA